MQGPPSYHTTTAYTMDLTLQYNGQTRVVEVLADDTLTTMLRKVASAVGLAEDSFDMIFKGEVVTDVTQLSAGDTVILAQTRKYLAVAELEALDETDLTEERLATVTNTEVACLLLQAEVADVIPDRFFVGRSLEQLDLSVPLAVTGIGVQFLSGCSSLTDVDLSGLGCVTRIGDGFLSNCMAIVALNLSGLSGVTKIGERFLAHCTSLRTVDLTALARVEEVGAAFLFKCSSLQRVDLSAFSRVTAIQNDFLSNCRSVTTVDLSGLRSVVSIGDNFLAECGSLTTVDLSELRCAASIGSGFFSNCRALTIDISGANSTVSKQIPSLRQP